MDDECIWDMSRARSTECTWALDRFIEKGGSWQCQVMKNTLSIIRGGSWQRQVIYNTLSSYCRGPTAYHNLGTSLGVFLFHSRYSLLSLNRSSWRASVNGMPETLSSNRAEKAGAVKDRAVVARTPAGPENPSATWTGLRARTPAAVVARPVQREISPK